MESIESWTRDYFLKNLEACNEKLSNGLTKEEKVGLRNNLNFKEHGKLVLLNHFMITDVKDNEFYCEKYEIKSTKDDSTRIELGKYADKLNIQDNETCEDPMKFLGERQVCVCTKSETNNCWLKEFESCTLNSNKRKIESDLEQNSYIVKVYDRPEMILNEVVEIIGFLYPTPQVTNDSMENEEFNEEAARHQPPYVIHAVKFKKQPHNNPILFDEIEDSLEVSAEEMHNDLLKMLTQFLFGDSLSAQYLLLHLISNVYSRVNGEALGKFTLNIICHAVPINVMTEYVKKLYSLIEMLVPNSFYLPLTIENLNTLSFVPKKDYVTNNLSSGVLQLPNHTQVLLDETKLENGKLDHAGCMAVGYFTELIKTQQLSYDFQFYKIPYNTNIPVLIMSEGKSLLPSDFAVPIKPVDEDSVRLINENFAAGIHYMRSKINAYRCYLTKCRIASFDIGENETKMIETDFVKLRETTNFQVENLHLLLVLSKLLGISKGLKQLDLNSWETAKQMETERNARMEQRNANEP